MQAFAWLVHLSICGVLFLTIRRRDFFRLEPYPALFGALLGGFAAMWTAQSGLGLLEEHGDASLVARALATGAGEELAKFLVVLMMLFVGREPAKRSGGRAGVWFDEPFDGLIYGGMAGLGAALYEGGDYLLANDPSAELIAQNVVRAFVHPLLGAVGAFSLGLWTIKPRVLPVMLAALATLGFAAACHAGWNVLAETDVLSREPRFAAFAPALGIAKAAMFLALLMGWLHLMFLANRWVIFYFPRERRRRMMAHCVLRWVMSIPRERARWKRSQG